MLLGFILLIIGIVFLLRNLGFISADAWDIIWPAIIIAIGIWILSRKKDGFSWKETLGWKKRKIKEE